MNGLRFNWANRGKLLAGCVVAGVVVLALRQMGIASVVAIPAAAGCGWVVMVALVFWPGRRTGG